MPSPLVFLIFLLYEYYIKSCNFILKPTINDYAETRSRTTILHHRSLLSSFNRQWGENHHQLTLSYIIKMLQISSFRFQVYLKAHTKIHIKLHIKCIKQCS